MSETIEEITQRVRKAGEFIPPLTNEIKKIIVGQDYLTERLILALITGEHILLEGVPGLAKTTNMRPDQVQRMGLTRTFQHTRLWREMTVIENLLVPPREQFAPNRLMSLLRPHSRIAEKERVLDAYAVLDTLQVSHMANHLASELSGGQSKLIDIGRALMGAPRCLLLDEPVAGVAAPLAEKIFQNLRDLVSEQGISVLVVEHNMDFILRAGVDRIVVMDRGRFLMEGTPDEVRQSRDVIEAYLGDPEDESV